MTRTDSLGSSLSWYGSSLGGDLAVVVTDGVVTIQIADLHGDVATGLTLDGSGAVTSVGAFADFDEYGRVLTVQPDTGAVTYGWLGACFAPGFVETRLLGIVFRGTVAT